MAVGPDQHGRRSGDLAEHRKLPGANMLRVDHLNSSRPWRDVEAAGLTKVEEYGPGVVQQGEYSQRAVGGDQVVVGHASPEQRVSLTEVVVDVEAREHRGDVPARLVHAEQFGRDVAKGLVTVVGAAERDLRHRVVQHAGTDRMPFGVVGVQEALG
jgi:hypothetical protein